MDIREFRHQLRRLERRLDNALQTGMDCCGITLMQCHTLLAIKDHGPLRMGELADRLELDKSTVSRSVDHLVKDGLVDRTPNPENRRSVTLQLSKAGTTRAQQIHAMCDHYFQTALNPLSETESAAVLKGITLLADALEKSMAAGECCAPARTGAES